MQKRLVPCNLRELYQVFKDHYPNEVIGLSKFADLRPKHCVLAGASGSHSVCVCTIHQNMKLMMLDAKLPDLLAKMINFSQHTIIAKSFVMYLNQNAT